MSKYSESYWRNVAAPIIAKVIAEHPNGVGLANALRVAYPFGEKRYHPYKIWRDEIARQTGTTLPLGTRTNVYGKPAAAKEADPNQESLF